MTGMGGTGRMLDRADTEGWSGMVTIGALVTLLGVAALVSSAATGIFTIIFMGAALVVAGALEIVQSFRRGRSHRALFMLGGIFSVVVGALMLARPAAGLATVSLMLAVFFIANGLFRAIGAGADQYPGWGWDLAYGVTAIVLGLFVTARWPGSSLWLLGTLIGIEIVARGLMLVALGFEHRRALREDMAHHRPQPT